MSRCLDWVLGLLAPPRCALCAAAATLTPPGLFCEGCGSALPEAPTGREVRGVPIVAPCRYVPPLSLAVKQLKYHGRTDVAPPLGALLASALESASLEGHELFVPVPLHPRRLAERGYNQSALIARASARALRARRPGSHFGVLPCALSRGVDTQQQARLTRDARASNVRRAFSVSSAAHVAGRSLVLVDDVVTTGATAAACIESLKESGGRVVLVAALCLAEDR